MISILPVEIFAEVEDSVLKDLLIDLGHAKQKHGAKLPDLSLFTNPGTDHNFDWDGFVRSVNEMEAATETMWRYLLDRIALPEGFPSHLRDILCLSVMCRLFQYRAISKPLGPSAPSGRATWGSHVSILDKQGRQLAESFGVSNGFDPSDHAASLAAYYGAAADGFREAARRL